MPRSAPSFGAKRKIIEFDGETWQALHTLALDRMNTVQELADEAFADLLKKHNRPVELKEALEASVEGGAAIPRRKRRGKPTDASRRSRSSA
jgi:hypothetical protein